MHNPQTVLARTFPCGRLPRLQSNEYVNHCSSTEKRLCRCSLSAWQKNYCGTTADTRLHKMSSSHCSSSFWSCFQLEQDLLSKQLRCHNPPYTLDLHCPYLWALLYTVLTKAQWLAQSSVRQDCQTYSYEQDFLDIRSYTLTVCHRCCS